jgi:IS1 family transposase
VYRAVLSEAQPVMGRLGTPTVARDHATTRHCSARMARRTKVVSKRLTMVDLSITRGIGFGDSDIDAQWQAVFLSVFT